MSFGGYAAATFTVVSDTAITAIAPAYGDGVVDVTVTNPSGTSAAVTADQYTYTATVPVVTAVTPASGPPGGGTLVTITGTGFASGTGVSFGSAPATNVSDALPTTITALAPAGSGTVDVTVTNPTGTSAVSAADQYSYSGAPTATVLFPNGGQTGSSTKVTVDGTGFVAGQTTVNFGGTVIPAASVSVQNARVLTFSTPAQAAPGSDSVTVTAPGGTTAPVPGGFTFNPPLYPVVNTVSPNVGPTTGGTTVTLTGTGFSGVTSVKFGSTAATSYTVNSFLSITAVVPASVQGLVSVSVTTHFGTGSGTYTYVAPPTVTSVSPASGSTAGGTTVTITGTGFKGVVASFGSLPFTGVTGVSFGSLAATSFTVNSDTSITATAPAAAAGLVDVTVKSSGGISATSTADQYTYQAPAPVCTTTITGTHSTQLTVSSGLTCLVSAKQSGSVTVAAGASLSVTNSTISGVVTATSPGAVTYCGSTESGTLTLSGDTGGVSLSSSSVNGAVYVQGNAGSSVTVAGNTVTGSLYCTGNNPAPADNGSVNTVSGTATSQCAAIATR